MNLILAERACLDGLDHKHALQNAAIDQRNADERLVGVFSGLMEVLEPRVVFGPLDGNGPHLLGNQARQTLVDSHA